jgi:hypothetical protein
MSPEENEEKIILFAVLQDIANELRRIKREQREAEKEKGWEQTETKASEYAS